MDGKKRKREHLMDDKPSSLARARATLIFLGASLFLLKNLLALTSRLRAYLRPQKQAGSVLTVAFLVDGENVTSPLTERLMERALDEAKKLGEVQVRRVYGGCAMFNHKWNEISLRLELEQIHLVKPTNSKNTADIALTVNAIELAKDGVCNRFCIVTSDSDFTPLVRRLRELKCQVLGIGERKTPNSLTKACSWFMFTDQLTNADSAAQSPHGSTPPPMPYLQMPVNPAPDSSNENQLASPDKQPDGAPTVPAAEKLSPYVISVLTGAYRDAVHGRVGEWVLLSRLGLSLRQLYPDFQAIDYAEDLSALIKQYHTVFEFGKRANGHPQMRLKP